MLETYLPITNVTWTPDTFALSHDDGSAPTAHRNAGRYAAAHVAGDTVTLTRDPLGLNKLYFAACHDRGVVAANYLADLIGAGINFDDVYAVPAGSSVTINPHARTIRLHRRHRLPTGPDSADSMRRLAHVRERLDLHVAAAAAAYPDATAAVCLSGGLDSALIAALIREHFHTVRAYTYAFDDHTGRLSPDAVAAQHLAHWLDLSWQLVRADATQVFAALPRAFRFGQDWRDFNVHCAIVNEILAAAIAADPAIGSGPVLVFTGDLMNEIVGDYTPVHYRGRDFYALPDVNTEHARTSFVRGLQCGDREVGVFAARGLPVIQPYTQVCDDLLQVSAERTKPEIMRVIAGDLLPPGVYERPKARAQIGAPDAVTGILPLLVDSGYTDDHLEREFLAALGVTEHHSLRGRIRAGVYRFPHHFPEGQQ
ncbi:hypothetical protein Aca07nite_87920 [Actinoplanes capillaceus]|uniref:asparagine synthase (glutamine-hydrolyzing) n=1 Tax=Actinoplanes campanulatus TaxID=113559 RepID=A0ABQ3WYZ4_9ACTN|nr:asparagine synthase-related protein [Actinoplanes capillaceus]GID51517.1 hypothetical protein Aca07nite_87920 [Actinoplanes capillaceus]